MRLQQQMRFGDMLILGGAWQHRARLFFCFMLPGFCQGAE